MNELERRLSHTLARRAETTGAPRFTVDAVVGAGRGARRRRRAVTVTGVAAATMAVILTLAAVLGSGVGKRPPADPTTPPVPSGPPPSVGPAAGLGVIGMAASGDWVIVGPDGSRTTVELPDQSTVLSAAPVAGGWLVHATTLEGNGHGLWMVAEGGAATRLADPQDTFAVSGDGRLLIVVTGGQLVAYELPARRELRRAVFPEAVQVVGVAGDWAVLRGAAGPAGSPASAWVWNVRTGGTGTSTGRMIVWSVAASGDVARLISPEPAAGQAPAICLDVVRLGDHLPEAPTGLCPASDSGRLELMRFFAARIAPGGDRIAVVQDDERREHSSVLVLATADLHAGQWRPRWLALADHTRLLFWDSATTFLTASQTDDGTSGAPYIRCTVEGACGQVPLPVELRHPLLIGR